LLNHELSYQYGGKVDQTAWRAANSYSEPQLGTKQR
jgi:hypothetical protein